MAPPDKVRLVRLSDVKTGSRSVVTRLTDDSPHERNKLMALGVLPGTDIELLQRFPSYVIRLGYTQIALDRETAQQILVQETSTN